MRRDASSGRPGRLRGVNGPAVWENGFFVPGRWRRPESVTPRMKGEELTQVTLSVSWEVTSALTLVAAARSLEPHFRAWFGHECDLSQVSYTLFTDADEAFHNQSDFGPLLEVVEGQPRHLILKLERSAPGPGVGEVEIWHYHPSPVHPIRVTVKLTGSDLLAVTRMRDRSRQRLSTVVEEVLGAEPQVGPDSISTAAEGALTASPGTTASVFDQIDQSARVGAPRRPRVFLSYSHDSPEHKRWVADLANRLNSLGIWLIFDQWDLELGGDLPRFMESGISEADRVIVICTAEYNRKANSGNGGAGYEKMIMTADLLQDQTSSRLVPVVRGTHSPSTPTFLRSRLYIDFTEDAQFEDKLDELSMALLTTGSQRPPFFPPIPTGS